jgi:hypothetical protein
MYLKERKKHPEWPSVPFEFYKNSGWVSWNDLFGKEKIKYLTLDELKSVLRNKKVKTTTEYRKLQKEHPEWPSNPPRAFKNSGWINWDDLLGK